MESQSLFRVEPNEEEQQLIHNMFLKTIDIEDPTFHKRVLPKTAVWIDSASISSYTICHPEVS